MKHSITFTFETDRALTADEVDEIISACIAQIAEPQMPVYDETDAGITQDADFSVTDIRESYKNELADSWAGVAHEHS